MAGRRHTVRFTLNGKPVDGEAEPRMLLTDFLRHVLGATGTHVGCEHGVCGACTIDIDGVPARACLTLAVQVDGASSGPSKGLRRRADRLGVLQEAFRAQSRAAVRLLHRRHSDVARQLPAPAQAAGPRTDIRDFSAGICAAAPAIRRSCARRWKPQRNLRRPKPRERPMLDLGTSFVASVARDPDAVAIVDGELRLTYAQWYARISSLVAGFDRLGLRPGDHLVTVLQNRWEAAHAALGLPVRRHRHHAGQLARQGGRDRFLHRECRGPRPSSTKMFRGAVAGQSKRAAALPLSSPVDRRTRRRDRLSIA